MSIYALDEALLEELHPDLIVTQELCDVCAVAYRDVAQAVRRLPASTREFTGRPGFLDLPCARAGRVAAVDGSSYFNRPGPRIAHGLEILAAILRSHPGSALPSGADWVEPAQRAALA